MDYTVHIYQNGCVGVTYNFVPDKSTNSGNFLDFKTLISCFDIFLHIRNNSIQMKYMVTQHTQVILNVGKCITSFWVFIPTHV